MRAYEVMAIIAPTLDEAAVETAVDKIAHLIEDRGGVVDKVNRWGKRRLAYVIAGQNDGFYVVYDFQADSSAVAELDRVLRLSEDVLRHLITSRELLPAPADEPEVAAEPEAEQVPAEG